jgi:hypothetical protein
VLALPLVRAVAPTAATAATPATSQSTSMARAGRRPTQLVCMNLLPLNGLIRRLQDAFPLVDHLLGRVGTGCEAPLHSVDSK